MSNLVELTVEKMFRCRRTDKQLQEGKYYFKVKDPQSKQSFVETYYIRGNTIDNHRIKIHGSFNPVRNLYVHDVCELLETLYEHNKTRTFRYLGEFTTMGRSPRTYHKLLDVECNYEYRHYSDLPIADWAAGEEKVLDIKLVEDSEELELSLHQESADDNPQISSVSVSNQEPEQDWLSPTNLFEMIEEKDNYDRLFMNVYRHAQNRHVVIPRFLKAVEEKRSSWVFEYINYLLETFIPSVKNDSQFIRDIVEIVIKLERCICETEGLMESLGVTDIQMCAQKARTTLQKAQSLKIMADLIDDQVTLVRMIEKMNRSLMIYGTIIEESDIQIAAVLSASLINLRDLLKQNGEIVVEFLNGLSYRHIIKDYQKSKIRVALKNELLSIPDNLADKVVIQASLALLADNEANLDEDERRILVCLLLLAIAKACDSELRGSALTALVNSLSSHCVPDGLVSWESFAILQQGLRNDCFGHSLQKIMAYWPADSNACSILLNCVETTFKNRSADYQKLLRESLLYCWHKIEAPDNIRRQILLLLTHICEIHKDSDGVAKYNAMLQEFDNKIYEERTKKLENEILFAIEAKRDELQTQWNELFKLAVSVGASDNTLSSIIDDREAAITKAETQIRIDFSLKAANS